jgi:uncharacterized membrane protein YphA (DoxX/SURF4 family)
MNENLKANVRLVLRYAIGALFLYSGFSKVVNPPEYFEVVIGFYRIFPPSLIPIIARTMPWIEFIFGAFLFLGYWTRGAASILAVSTCLFQLVLAQALMRGLDINECGCFGGGLVHLTLYESFVMDTTMTLCLIWIASSPMSRFGLDAWLLKDSNSDSASNPA